jgi:hypothetical protein
MTSTWNVRVPSQETDSRLKANPYYNHFQDYISPFIEYNKENRNIISTRRYIKSPLSQGIIVKLNGELADIVDALDRELVKYNIAGKKSEFEQDVKEGKFLESKIRFGNWVWIDNESIFNKLILTPNSELKYGDYYFQISDTDTKFVLANGRILTKTEKQISLLAEMDIESGDIIDSNHHHLFIKQTVKDLPKYF